ncbi:MAG: hypothetical protein O2905_05775 [Proteobacteria bacterium]|nr:hypothetical protein [Pseudomonadota bacterium]
MSIILAPTLLAASLVLFGAAAFSGVDFLLGAAAVSGVDLCWAPPLLAPSIVVGRRRF